MFEWEVTTLKKMNITKLLHRILKFCLLFCFILFYSSVWSQDASLGKQIKRIDSLQSYNQIDEAYKEAKLLYAKFSSLYSGKEYRKDKLNVMLLITEIQILENMWKEAGNWGFDVIEYANQYGFPDIAYSAHLKMALIYEQAENYDRCQHHLNKAYELYITNNLKNLFSTYCIRKASLCRYINQKDSTIYFAKKGLEIARQFNNKRDILDAYLLLGHTTKNSNYLEAINFTLLAAKEFLNRNNLSAAATMFSNIGRIYMNNKQFTQAKKWSDSSRALIYKTEVPEEQAYGLLLRSQIFDSLGNKDSAYYYFKTFHYKNIEDIHNQEAIAISKLAEGYENKKKEIVIKSKDKQISFTIVIIAIVISGTVLLFRKNKKIHNQNKIINKQLEELKKALEQKQVLLLELQHRVKNNLQHVVSILEIQKESVDFNNIEELIRGNQNRIHSMALLHKKLNISESINDIEICRYINELSELVKHSYESPKKHISLRLNCVETTMTLEKALPIGMILVELISNSMKHAFKNKTTGAIMISLTKNVASAYYRLSYSDDGSGFDFFQEDTKGLGMEIVRGLINQLDATVESLNNKGFQLTLMFK